MDPAEVEQAIKSFHENNGDSSIDISKICTALKNRDLQLLILIEKLGWLLSSSEKADRNTGLKILVEVLQDTTSDVLSTQEVECLVTFFCTRLSDHHDFLPLTLQGLLLLSAYPGLGPPQVQLIVRSIFSEVHAPAQLQEDRRKIYSMLSHLLDNHIPALQDLHSEFIVGFIQTMDGERDPRCLLTAFRIVNLLTTNFDIGENTEDLFEVIACYFPVDFRAPTEDPFGIRCEELSQSLEQCLSSTPKFAPYCLPLLLEKLNSDLDSAKLDALSVLQSCSNVYGVTGLKDHLKDFWAAIRREVFSGRSEGITFSSLKALTALVSSLAKTQSSELDTFLDSVWKECSQVIQGDSELSIVSASLLRAALSGATSSHRTRLMKKALLHMLQVLKDTTGPQRSSHLQALSVMLDVPSLGPFGSWNSCPEVWSLLISLLSPDEDQAHQRICTYCWLAIEKLLKIGSVLPESEVLPLVQRVLSHVEHQDNLSKSALIQAIKSLSHARPDVFEDLLVPGLLQILSKGGSIIEALSALAAANPTLAEKLILDPLIQKLKEECVYEEALSTCLESLVSSREAGSHLDSLTESFFYPLLGEVLNDAYKSDANLQDRPLHSALQSLASALSPRIGIQVAQDLLQVIVSAKPSVKWRQVVPKDFQTLPRDNQSALSLVLRCVLPHLSPCEDPCPYPEAICWLTSRSLLDDHDQFLAQAVAGLANKCPCCCSSAFDLLKNAAVSEPMVITLIWLTKGLLLRGHPCTSMAITKMLELLSDPHLGHKVAMGFETILEPSKYVFSPSSHPSISLFYCQRFFLSTAPTLLKYYNSATKETKGNYLHALCCQLKYLPLPVLKQELPPLLTVLVAALDSNQEEDKSDLLTSALGALCLLLASESSHLASPYLATLLAKLTQLATGHPLMKVRMDALRCLSELTSLPTSQLLIHSTDVLRELRPCLGDSKRLVRRQAAQTVCRWHLVGQEVVN